MIITTTPSVEGKKIIEYKGIVFGEIVSGVDFVKDIAASFSNFFGGRSGSYEEELIQAIEDYNDYYTNDRPQPLLGILTPMEYHQKQKLAA